MKPAATSTLTWARSLFCAGILVAGIPGWVAAADSNWTFTADLTLKETFDSNVFLQDAEPDRTLVPQAVSPFQESFVTSITPKLALGWKPSAAFKADLSYAPEAAFYHAEPSEDYLAHRVGLNLKGKLADVPWDFANALTWVDGSDRGLYFGAPGGAPAIGGVPIRDRRDQFVYRGKLSATVTRGKWFLRPVMTGYEHDFQTVQLAAATNPGYENYVDRSEVGGGADVGWQAAGETWIFVGYRYGKEVQGRLVGSPYHYDATYNRPLVGVEGQPARWVKLGVSVGMDFHETTGQPAPGFDPNYESLWADAVATLLLSPSDTLVLTWRQNTQPAFASSSVYADIVYEALFTHRFNPHWSAGLGGRAYGGDWLSPVARDDWIFTLSGKVAYVHDAHWSGEVGYSYDNAVSQVPNTPGREFTRHLVSFSAKYSF